MTGLKDEYQSGEESHLGNTGQDRMEINEVTTRVPTGVAQDIQECEDTLNALGNCYACNNLGHVKRDCPTQTQARMNYSGGQKKEFSCYNCDKQGLMARDCLRRIKEWGQR